MWGGTPQRNMVNTVEKNIPTRWDVNTGKNIKWVAQLGSQSFGSPVVAGGKIFVGTNNLAERQPAIKGDKGIFMCFRESDGKFLWQNVHDKLAAGRVNDWPEQGICSTCCVDGDRVYYVSNRCQLICADVNGANDGSRSGKIIWKLDMMKDLGVFPHNMSASSPNIDGNLVFVVTGNGVDERHILIPAAQRPQLHRRRYKMTGEVKWSKVGPGEGILHGQWSSPAIGVIGGVKQVVFPGGDGRLYAYEAETGKELWSFQCNPEGTVWKLGLGTRNNLIATPGNLQGPRLHLPWARTPSTARAPDTCTAIDATKRGDITKTGIDLAQRRREPRPGHGLDLRQRSLPLRSRGRASARSIPIRARSIWQHDMGSAGLELAVLCRRQGLHGRRGRPRRRSLPPARRRNSQHDGHGRIGLHHARGRQRRALHQHAREALCHPARRALRREESELSVGWDKRASATPAHHN